MSKKRKLESLASLGLLDSKDVKVLQTELGGKTYRPLVITFRPNYPLLISVVGSGLVLSLLLSAILLHRL